MRELVNSIETAGTHSIVWNGKDKNSRTVSSGIYFTSFDVNDEENRYTSVKKIILMK